MCKFIDTNPETNAIKIINCYALNDIKCVYTIGLQLNCPKERKVKRIKNM